MTKQEALSCVRTQPHRATVRELGLALVLAAAIVMPARGHAGAPARAPDTSASQRRVENQLGIQIVGLRRSAAGYMLDFRYHLVDPAKASALLDRKVRPYLLDEATGATLAIPEAPKVGQLRPTSRNKVIAGRNYYMLFANPGRFLSAGSRVTLVAGDVKIRHLTVE